MEAIQKIQNILNSINPQEKNKDSGIFLNSVKNEFITFPSTITVPKIPVKELPYELAVGIVERLCSFFPEFFIYHRILPKRKPAADVHTVQFMRPLQGKEIFFVHFLKVDLRFGGDSSNIIEKGNTETYPSYITNRMYYKSRLVPVETIEENDFTPLRLLDSVDVMSDMRRRTFAMFDEVSMKKFNNQILEYIDQSIFATSQNIYPFFVFDFFTPCFNVLRPTFEELQKAVEIFEPVFLYLFNKFSNKMYVNKEKIQSQFASELTFFGEELQLSDELVGVLKHYFSRYSIIRDDELALRGWWKIEIK